MVRNCFNCFLAKTALMNDNIFCGLNGQAVKYPDTAVCRDCITDDDRLSAWAEDLAKKHDVVVGKIKLRDEMEKVKADIHRVKLARKKLWLEKKQNSQYVEFHNYTLGKIGAAFGPSLDPAGRIKPLPSQLKTDHSQMQTFLCENCGEYVLVPEEGVGKKVQWKCMACHQENCFEVNKE